MFYSCSDIPLATLFMILSSFISLHQAINWTDLQKAKKNLCEIDTEKYNSFENHNDKLLFLVARMLLSKLALRVDGSFSLKNLNYSNLGKPYFEGIFDMSISHSGKYCAVAVSDCSTVGVDIQMIRNIEIRDYEFILEERDFRLLTEKKNERRLEFFFQRWTVIEAIMKADGRGFHLDPNLIREKEDGYVITDNNRKFFKMDTPFIEGYELSLVCDNKEETIRWVYFDCPF